MLKHSKISEYKIKKLKLLCKDLTAVKAANILKLNRKTINRYYGIFREKIMQASKVEMESLGGEVERDESYFGAKRVRGKRGSGAAGKTPVFGILKRDGKVFVSVVKIVPKSH
jgi:transposase-like protein